MSQTVLPPKQPKSLMTKLGNLMKDTKSSAIRNSLNTPANLVEHLAIMPSSPKKQSTPNKNQVKKPSPGRNSKGPSPYKSQIINLKSTPSQDWDESEESLEGIDGMVLVQRSPQEFSTIQPSDDEQLQVTQHDVSKDIQSIQIDKLEINEIPLRANVEEI